MTDTTKEHARLTGAPHQDKLPLWPSNERAMPSPIMRSALFTAANRKTARQHFRQQPIYVYGDGDITYTGEELRTDDEDVLMTVLHLYREQMADDTVEFSPYPFLKELRWPTTPHYANKLQVTLDRLSATSMTFRSKRLQRGVSLSLVRRFEWQDEQGARLARWSVTLEPEISHIFNAVNFTRVEWDTRQSLKRPAAKRLYDYICSHRHHYPIKLQTLRDITGLACSIREFRRALLTGRKASGKRRAEPSIMKRLYDAGIVSEYHLDDFDRLHLQRSMPAAS